MRLMNTCISIVIFFSVLLILVTMGTTYIDNNYFIATNKTAETVTIPQGSSVADVGAILENKNIIKKDLFLELYLMIMQKETKINPGIFTVQPNTSFKEIVNTIESAPELKEKTVQVTIPEGFTIEQIGERLEESHVCSKSDFVTLAMSEPTLDYWFLKDLPNYEGFLFPDTYEFYYYSTAKQALKKFISTFDDKLVALGFTAENQNPKIYDLIKTASLIEKESYHKEDMTKISSVIKNRQDIDMLLQIDASLLYSIGHKEKIYQKDLEIDDPYNLYKYKGLPPTPICNPGLNAINAALNPAKTNYIYYVADGKTKYHHFSKTYEEHQQNITKYMN